MAVPLHSQKGNGLLPDAKRLTAGKKFSKKTIKNLHSSNFGSTFATLLARKTKRAVKPERSLKYLRKEDFDNKCKSKRSKVKKKEPSLSSKFRMTG